MKSWCRMMVRKMMLRAFQWKRMTKIKSHQSQKLFFLAQTWKPNVSIIGRIGICFTLTIWQIGYHDQFQRQRMNQNCLDKVPQDYSIQLSNAHDWQLKHPKTYCNPWMKTHLSLSKSKAPQKSMRFSLVTKSLENYICLKLMIGWFLN